MKSKAIHIASGLGSLDGGPSYTVPRLCGALRSAGWNVDLLAVEQLENPAIGVEGAIFFQQSLKNLSVARAMRLSSGLYRAAVERARGGAGIVHTHGLWLMPNVYAGDISQRFGNSLVISPRGMLAAEALEYSRLKKQIFWLLLLRRAYQNAAVWHATSTEEANEIRAFGIISPIATIPNGVDLPLHVALHPIGNLPRTLLFLSRIHPKKGLPSLIEAWARVAVERPDWRLVIAGPDEDRHRATLEAQIATRNVPRVYLSGPVYGKQKESLIQQADVFVLPTLNENFGVVVAEALAAGVPSIVSKGAPWRGLEAERCGWWIDHGIEPLVAAIRQATALPPAVRQEMGARGRNWMQREYSWSSIAARMAELYEWAAGIRERPDFVT